VSILVVTPAPVGSPPCVALWLTSHPPRAAWVGVQCKGYAVSDETIADAGEPLRIRWFDDSVISSVPVGR